MPPSQDITAESFKFNKSIQSTGKRKATSSAPLRKRQQLRRRTLSQQQQQQSNRSFTTTTLDLDSFEEDFNPNDISSSSERSHILKNLMVVIDRQLWESQRLGQLIIAMGGETSNDMNKRVTHVVHAPITRTATKTSTNTTKNNQQPKPSRLVNQALASCARLVSPQWVVDCYEQRKRLAESYYPYDTDPSRVQQRLGYQQDQKKVEKVEQSDHDDNPFQVNPNDYLLISSDEEEEVKSDDDKQPVNQNERQRKQFTKQVNYSAGGEDNETTDDDELLQSNAQQPPPDDLSVQSNQVEEERGYDEEGEDGQVLLRKREKRSAAISKILQAVQESKERKQQQYHQRQQQQQQDEITITPLLESYGSDVGYLGSEEKMQVWYDEQSVNHIDPSMIPGPSTTSAATTANNNSRSRRTTTPVRRNMTTKLKRER
ncbi:hypothetical protein BDC45DRAFT_557353 [Circinella umbellata]|nr:hypothetical protein BDC45DRAFT_557353 [Circinella umbellata]